MRKKYSADDIAEAMEIMFEPVRFGIVSRIASLGTCRAVDVLEAFDLTQPSMSHHLNLLVEKEVLSAVKEGRCVYYSVNPNMMKEASDILDSFAAPAAPKTSKRMKAPAKNDSSEPSFKKESKSKSKDKVKVKDKDKDKVKSKGKGKDKDRKEKSRKKKKK